jgi:putative phosphoesterase
MKFLVLTDIHGSSKYLKMAMKKYEERQCEKILLLGDILYHGPRNDLPMEYEPKTVISILNSYKNNIISVKGNCDAEVDEMVLEFPLFPEATIKINGKNLYLTHGHHLDEIDEDGYIMYGHTHVNKIEGKLINIGSLSIPKDNHHTYAIIEDGKLTSYDLLTDEVIMELVF